MLELLKKADLSAKLDDLLTVTKLAELLGTKAEPVQVKEEKKTHPLVIALAVIGAVAAVAGIAYCVYKWMNPDYLEEFEDYEDEDYEDFDSDETEAEA